jgi:hypothetical protein
MLRTHCNVLLDKVCDWINLFGSVEVILDLESPN